MARSSPPTFGPGVAIVANLPTLLGNRGARSGRPRAMTRTRRIASALAAAGIALGVAAAPAGACGGLVAPNGAVRLLRTSTLAAYHDGVEHYVTSFQFAGGSDQAVGASDAAGPSEFGSIVPLPGIPTTVERGGD